MPCGWGAPVSLREWRVWLFLFLLTLCFSLPHIPIPRLHVPPTLDACHNTSPAVTSGTIFRHRLPVTPVLAKNKIILCLLPKAKTSPLPWSDPPWLH